MPLSLDDVLSAPQDPALQARWIQARGLAPAPVSPTAGAGTPPIIAPMAPRTLPPLSSVTPLAKTKTWEGQPEPATAYVSDHRPGIEEASHAEIGSLAPPAPRVPLQPLNVAGLDARQPEAAAAAPLPGGLQPMVPPTPPAGSEILNAPRKTLEAFHSREQDAPDIDRMAPVGLGPQILRPGTLDYNLNQLDRREDEKANPYGTPQNHPGVIGKILHGLAKAGNIAGDIVAPKTMAIIPGTDLNKKVESTALQDRVERQQEAETKAKTEEERMHHDVVMEDQNERKIDQIDKKLNETEWKDKSQNERELRKQGLKPDPDNPGGPPIPVSREEMSDLERNVVDLKDAQRNVADARADYLAAQADPNSPKFKQAQERLRIMAKNAATAAGRLGLETKKYLADYMGIDEEGKPLAGVRTDEEGRPIGPRITNAGKQRTAAFQKNYVDASETTERAYQMYRHAQEAYDSGDTQTGAATMLALSQHIGTTFGQVKGSRQTRDLINEHRDAIGVMDRIERFGARIVRGDQLSASQMKEFGDMIHQFRDLSWQTAVKEAKRQHEPIDFLPTDLETLESTVPAPKNVAPHAGAGAAPAKGSAASPEEGATRTNKRTGEVQNFTGGKWQTIKPPTQQ